MAFNNPSILTTDISVIIKKIIQRSNYQDLLTISVLLKWPVKTMV